MCSSWIHETGLKGVVDKPEMFGLSFLKVRIMERIKFMWWGICKLASFFLETTLFVNLLTLCIVHYLIYSNRTVHIYQDTKQTNCSIACVLSLTLYPIPFVNRQCEETPVFSFYLFHVLLSHLTILPTQINFLIFLLFSFFNLSSSLI